MDIKLAWLLDDGIEKQYTLDYAGDSVQIGQVRDIFRQAKNRFKILGRRYIMIAGDKTFYIVRANHPKKSKISTRDWNVFQVGVEISEQVK